MKITLAQTDPTVGDIQGNGARLGEAAARAASEGADLVVFPELYLTGYPPKDLLERPQFIDRVSAVIRGIVRASEAWPGTGVLFGAPVPTGSERGKPLHNAALLIEGGRVLLEQHKSLLPTYDVFDEQRHFAPARDVRTVRFAGETLGISICEDAWNVPDVWPEARLYSSDPIASLAGQGTTLFINISASPFQVGKEEVRFKLIGNQVRRHRRPFVLVNQVGGNDDLVFDGASFCLDAAGEPFSVLPSFREEIRTVETKSQGTPGLFSPPGRIEAVYEALVLGLRDYMRKCGFSRTVLGLSGGIDSAVTCVLAAAAAGPGNVLALTMPSAFSSPGSVDDSLALASTLGVRALVVPIDPVYRSYLGLLEGLFAGKDPDITEENIQARIRGNILFAFSNKFGYLVLSTGNKSELAVGYCTLYGDMSGGLAVISDVPKTMVYELAAFINRERETIPAATIAKPPSAELRPGQLDLDTLPPYPVLDAILHAYVEELRSVEEIAAMGFDRKTTAWVAAAVDRNEYKRKQAAPGLKVTSKAFGAGRRMPIAAAWER